jgi:hypothetical protein
MRTLTAKLLLLVIVSILSVRLNAQDAASITGVVTDESGAVVPNVSVTLVNTGTSAAYKAETNAVGSYLFVNVAPGSGYKITFTRDGFKPEVISDIYLTVGGIRTLNARLTLGAASQTVLVSAANATVSLDMTDATIGNNIDVQWLNELPIYDRTAGITTLFTQQPGVDSNQGAVTGARIDQTDVTIDGLDVNDVAAGTTFAIVASAPVDSVEQFTGSVAGFASSVGTGSGAQFQMVTKSGTNKFHGNVNEYHRDTTTVANTWFNNLNGIPRTPLIRNQFGGNIGGPVLKDRLFFFFDLADSKIVQSSTSEPIVPMAAFRAGTLNYINNGTGCDDTSRLNTQPACISTLTADQVKALDPGGVGFDSAALAFINSRYPDPAKVHLDLTQGDGVNTAGYRFTTPTPNNQITYVGRVDYNLTPTQKIFGRFTINRQNAIQTLPQFPTDPVTHPRLDRSYAYVVSHTWNIGKNKVNQFYYGDNISKLSFPDNYNPTGVNQYSFSGLDGPYTSYDGQKRRVPIPVVRDDFNWQRGAHSLSMGGTFKFIKTNSNLVNNFNFVAAGLQGSALANGLDSVVRPPDINTGPNGVAALDYDQLFATGLGVIGDISTNFNYDNKGNALPAGSGGPRAYRFYETEAYVGDTWKVNRKLTLSFGLRYQLYSVPYEVHGDQSVPTNISFDTFIKDRLVQSKAGDTSNTGLPIYSYVLGGKANHGPDLYGMSYKDLSPRVAFAYTPFKSEKTVLNGGAGIIYDRTVINAINFLQDQLSNLFSNSNTSQFGSADGADASLAADTRLGTDLAYSATLNPAPTPITTPFIPYVDSNGVPFGLAQGQAGFVISPTLKDPYSIALNFGVQQEIPGQMVMKVNYVGRLGRRLLADADANQVIDVPDYTGKSTQSMVGAFADLTKQLRALGPAGDCTTVIAEPWFEDVLQTPSTNGRNTRRVACNEGTLVSRGDISDSLQGLAGISYDYGLNWLPINIGIPSQFGTNAYLTNMGSSNYHGLLFTLDKNLSQGLRFQFNYTWSHSIDNTSLSANSNSLFGGASYATGLICDVFQPRACRGNSDFDVRQEISSDFEYNLPVGRGKTFLANSSRWVDQTIGGWSLSGIPAYRTGLAVTAYSDAFLASFDNDVPAIFTGNKSDLKARVNVDHSSNTVYDFAGGAAGAAKVASEFRGPIGLEYGQRNMLRGPGAFFFDAGLGKTFPILEDKLNLIFRADAFNLFNHPAFGPPAGGDSPGNTSSLTLVTGVSNFGQIIGTTGEGTAAHGSPVNTSRVAQFSLRLEF